MTRLRNKNIYLLQMKLKGMYLYYSLISGCDDFNINYIIPAYSCKTHVRIAFFSKRKTVERKKTPKLAKKKSHHAEDSSDEESFSRERGKKKYLIDFLIKGRAWWWGREGFGIWEREKMRSIKQSDDPSIN